MTAIQKYKSDNGREFNTPAEARKADALFAAQNDVSAMLPQAVDEGCNFANGGGYIQQSEADIIAFKHGIRRLIVFEFGENSECLKAWERSPVGFVGRYLDDSGSDTYRLWSRLANIDEERREWGQGYYRLHPNEGTLKPWPKITRAGMKYFGK